MATTTPIKSSADIQRVRAILFGNRDKALFELGLHLAFRGGDLLSLNLGHVIGKVEGDEVTLKEGKTKKRRMTTLNAQCVAVLRPLIEERLAEGAQEDDPLFVSVRAKTRITIVTLSRMWKDWTTKAGLKGTFGSHSGRKTKAYLMRTEHGMSIPVLMSILGHESEACTLRYACIQSDEQRKFYLQAL